jgi:hypothetical protein
VTTLEHCHILPPNSRLSAIINISPADKQGQQKMCMSGSTAVSDPLLKYRCPECAEPFQKWSTCLEHLKATGHANPGYKQGLQQRCMSGSVHVKDNGHANSGNKQNKKTKQCPECAKVFNKWSTCLEHLRATGHANSGNNGCWMRGSRVGDSGGLCGVFGVVDFIGDVKRRRRGPWSSSYVHFHVVSSNIPEKCGKKKGEKKGCMLEVVREVQERRAAAAATREEMASRRLEGLSASPNNEMGLVEVLEPHHRAYVTAFLVDIHESGQQNLVRTVRSARSLSVPPSPPWCPQAS